MDADDDAPIIRLINAILSQTIQEQASDIHIGPGGTSQYPRRVDGVLSEVLSPKRTLRRCWCPVESDGEAGYCRKACLRMAASRCA